MSAELDLAALREKYAHGALECAMLGDHEPAIIVALLDRLEAAERIVGKGVDHKECFDGCDSPEEHYRHLWNDELLRRKAAECERDAEKARADAAEAERKRLEELWAGATHEAMREADAYRATKAVGIDDAAELALDCFMAPGRSAGSTSYDGEPLCADRHIHPFDRVFVFTQDEVATLRALRMRAAKATPVTYER